MNAFSRAPALPPLKIGPVRAVTRPVTETAKSAIPELGPEGGRALEIVLDPVSSLCIWDGVVSFWPLGPFVAHCDSGDGPTLRNADLLAIPDAALA
jgi:hypothetical protein